MNLCIIRHPHQLLKSEAVYLKTYVSDNRFHYWPLISVYHQMRRENVANYCINAFYKYVNLLDLAQTLPSKRRKNYDIGIRTDTPLKLLHIDVTRHTCKNGGKTFIYVVKDNFSKAILCAKAALELRSFITIECINDIYEKYLKAISFSIQIMSDGGHENKHIKKWILEKKNTSSIQHITAQTDVEHSNSMAEAANRSLKYYALFQMHIPDFAALQQALDFIVIDYNTRPNNTLSGLTPYEVLENKSVNDIFLNNTKTVITKTVRIVENKESKCCNYSF